jgi:hypothetical protein
LAAIVALLFAGSTMLVSPSPRAQADGSGSPTGCLGTTEGVEGSIGATGGGSQATFTVESDEVITGVCIASGTMFGGTGHSAVLGNGTVEECYEVTGVGTQTVTVTRGEESPECQDISHIDVVFEEDVEEIGSLAVLKTCTDGEGEFTFNLLNSADVEIDSLTAGCGETATFEDIPAGSGYSVVEEATDGFSETGNTCDNETIESGETSSCTITNTPDDEDLGSIAVFKACNTGADPAADFTFTLYTGDDEVIDTDVVSCGETASFVGLAADDYYVLESSIPDSFSEEATNCGAIAVDPDEDEACTITNFEVEEAVIPAPPQSIVVEVVEPTAEPTPQPPASPVEQVLGVQQVITPPNTGDGGLVDTDGAAKDS